MSDAGFRIDVPKGARAAKIRVAMATNKARILANIDARLATELDPDTRTELEALRVVAAAESIQRFVMRQFRAAVVMEERGVKLHTLQETHKQQIRQELQAYLQQFEEI